MSPAQISAFSILGELPPWAVAVVLVFCTVILNGRKLAELIDAAARWRVAGAVVRRLDKQKGTASTDLVKMVLAVMRPGRPPEPDTPASGEGGDKRS